MATGGHVHADAVAPVSAAVARARLWATLSARAGVGAHRDHLEVSIAIGPRGAHAPRHDVRLQLGAPVHRRRTDLMRLSWKPIGRFAALYPRMAGVVAITAVSDTTSLVSLTGDYTPPFGPAGEVVDRAAMARMADSTAHAFVADLVHVASRPAAPSTAEEGSS